MKYLFDIGHPAHVHYFRNAIKILQNNGHDIKITARDKEVALNLLTEYQLKYVSTGPNHSSLLGKFISLIRNDFIIYKEASKFNPDLLVSFHLPFTAHIGKLLNIPVIGFDDTENAKLNNLLSVPFTDFIITPDCYTGKFEKSKHLRFSGYFELAYLHPCYFRPDPRILRSLDLEQKEKYVIFRFVSWGASHDFGHRGFSLKMKRKAVKELSKYAKIFISSEGELPEDLKQYQIKIPPEKMHDALAFAILFFGESATMASESAVLGTPAIYLDDVGRGYTDEQEKKFGLVFNYTASVADQEKSIQKGIEILKRPDLKNCWRKKSEKMIADKIDVTAFLVWFVENYPESAEVMKKNPRYQYQFRTKLQSDMLHCNN